MAQKYIIKNTYTGKAGGSFDSWVIDENGFGMGVTHLGNKVNAKRFTWRTALKVAKRLGDRYSIEPDTEPFNIQGAIEVARLASNDPMIDLCQKRFAGPKQTILVMSTPEVIHPFSKFKE